MSNPEEQQGGSHLLNIMKKNLDEEPEEEGPNKFSPNFHPLNSLGFNNKNNQEQSQNKTKQDTETNYDDFLNAGGDKLISGLAKLNLGNNSSQKKHESNNYVQNPIMNMNSKNNQKDLAFNYFFGSGIQGDSSKKGGESGGQTVSSQFLEHLRLNSNNDNNEINEQHFKNYLNNQGNDINNQNEDESQENNMYKLNQNNMNQNQQGKIMMNMNFQNKNNNNQKMNLNENTLNQNQNNNNKLNNLNMNNMNINNQMMQMNNNMNMGGNIPYNNMDPRIRNMIQQNMIRNNMMNNMQMNQNQVNMNNQNNFQMNQKNNNKKNKKKNKNNKSNNNNNNNNNVNIQNMNLIMNQQQPQMINYQNYNQFIPNQNMQNPNLINYPSSSNQSQLNFNNRGFIPNNNSINMNLNNIPNMQNYNMNIQQQNKYIQQSQNEGGYMQNNIPMQIMNNNMGMNISFNQINLEQIINRANNSFPGKFFVIKSIDESNIMSSIRFKIWCSTIKGNQKLQKAYKEADKKYPIFLFFSVNGSGKFMGIALMKSDVEYKVNFNYWSQNDKWKGFFLVDWICIKDVPNRMFRAIINDLNENKPVTSSRDTQEICTSAGVKMLKVFKDYPQESTIFDSQTNEMK